LAIVQISRIQQRRGLQQDLPQLASAEMGWSLDERRLYIGNGTIAEGAPSTGMTELITEHSDILNLLPMYTFKGLSAGFTAVTGPTIMEPIQRTLQNKLDDYVSVKDFGAMGDGVTDDTAAIQRALDRAFSTNQLVLQTNYHRTIYFPAGTYIVSATINIPPYTRIQGEGKRTTIVEGLMAAPISQFVDSFGQFGVDYGTVVGLVTPDIAEYHLSDISFIHTSTSYDQSCLVIDGAWTATFNRCMFRGMLRDTSGDYAGSYSLANPIYDVDRGTGVAAVCINNNATNAAVRNLIFNQCDFLDHNYGIEINNEVRGVTITSCYFDHFYRSIVGGKNSSYIPFGFSIIDNYFRWSAAEAMYFDVNVNNVMSEANMIIAAGLGDWESATSVHNLTGLAQTPAITFNDNNNFSIADSFNRGDADYALFPNIKTNGYECYIVGQDLGVVSGKLTQGTGHTTSLTIAVTVTSAGMKYIPTGYTNLTIGYTITANSQQRAGVLKVVKVGSTYTWDDEYTQTGNTGVVFSVNTSTGNIEYTATAVAALTYNLNYFTA